MPKPINLSITFRLPKDRKVASASIKPDGEIVFIDDSGKEITPEYMERTVHFHRPKGPKVQSRNKVIRDRVTVGGLDELAKYESVFVIDTNTRTIRGQKTSAACFICCRFVPEGNKVRIKCDGKLNIYEFHGVPEHENAEMLAILKVARDVARSAAPGGLLKIAFVSDSALGSHDEISTGLKPIYGDHFLPQGFVLHYASPETGQEAINRLIKFCDKQSSNYLKCLGEGSVKRSELKPLEEDPSVQYRYMFRDDLEIINPIVGGISVRPGMSALLQGMREPHNI